MKRGWSGKGQVTVFIIVAVLIVAVAVLMYFIYPKIRSPSVSSSPTLTIQSCMEDELKNAVEKISLQGGVIEPEFYMQHGENKVEYLCYSGEYFKRCVVQNPLLKISVENEIKSEINEKVKSCFDAIEEDYRNKGYEVSLARNDYDVEIQAKQIVVNFDYDLSISKEATNRYENFKVRINNNLYNLLLIAKRVIESEVQYGEADVTIYMDYYSWLKAEKAVKSDGTKIYILTDRNSGDKFQFASRSMVIAPGYG
jgi:hypothetical protein